jgi:hypothetical protein
MLICSILKDEKNDPALSVRNIVKAIRALAGYLNIHDRVRIAELMRDVADEVEQRCKA